MIYRIVDFDVCFFHTLQEAKGINILEALIVITPQFTDVTIPPNEFLTPVNSKRLIKPRNPKDFMTTNIVTDHARNNSQSYRVAPTKTAVYRYSFFPQDYHRLEQLRTRNS